MQWFKKATGWVWAHLGNIALVAGWLMSAGFFPALLAIGQGATPVQYGMAAIGGLLTFWIIRALADRAKTWRAQRRLYERLSSESSPFDPMARSYEGKRLFLKDLVPPGRRVIEDRKFTDCEIIGPGSIVVCLNKSNGAPSIFRNNIYHDVDCIQIDPNVLSNNAIYFPGCDFDGCQFWNVNMLFYERHFTDWHWITPTSAQIPLIEAGGSGGGGKSD